MNDRLTRDFICVGTVALVGGILATSSAPVAYGGPPAGAESVRAGRDAVASVPAPVDAGARHPGKLTRASSSGHTRRDADSPRTRQAKRHKSAQTGTAGRIDWIDPMIGTGGLGYEVGSIAPGPTLPFGMVKLGPDTTTGGLAPGFSHCAGYWYLDPQIRGFSHNHLSGTGVADQGNIRVMAVLGMDSRQATEAGYRSSFSHDTEVASPGYYAVTLDDGDIRVELTATEHVGFHRYTFPAAPDATLLIDPSAVIGEGTASDVTFEIIPEDQEIVGSMINHGSLSGRYGGQPIFFSARFKTPFDRFGVFNDGVVLPDQVTTSGGTVMGAYVQYKTAEDQAVELEVGISYISIDQARENLELEATGQDFDEIRADAEAAWEEAMSAIDVEGGTDAQKRNFYTGLYHSMMMPTLYTDANGLYRGFDQQVHQADGFTYYTDMSLWDTFRTTHPLFALIDPQRQGDFVTSMLRMFDQSGYIDRWPQGNGATGCMVGDSPAIVISESYLKGVRNFDVDHAYDALLSMGTLETDAWHRDNLREYLELGYVPADVSGSSVSKTVEYAYNDGALAYFAAALGRDADAAMFAERATYYRNNFDYATGFLQGRYSDGTWETPFLAYAFMDSYAEGNAYQWSWYAPHDVAGLVDLFGGPAEFEARLDEFFDRSVNAVDTILPDVNYWHGNEPDIQVPYYFHYIGRPDKSQQWARWVLETKYSDTPDGLDGNDDGGTMSAWYVFSALGLFPVAGTDVYLIGSPVFTKTTLHLSGGDFTLVAPDASEANLYVQSARLNGAPLEQSWLRHADIAVGGTLELEMGPAPSTWASSGPLPPSLSTGG